MILKKDAVNKFMIIKYWISNPVQVKFQEHWSSLFMNIEESMIIGEKNTDFQRLTGQLKLRLMVGIGWFHWNQGEKVADLAWFGEPWE